MTTELSYAGHRQARGRSNRAQRGQTIVIALLVLVLLAFLGGLFATIVTRNLQNAGRSNSVQTADYYAQAGIRFADDELTNSLDGADWRPPMQYPVSANFQPKDTIGLARYNAIKGTLPALNANDPDYNYLVQGFTRYNIGGGRYLLRVTYDPAGLSNADNTTGAAYSSPLARYIKIESVGRVGVVDPDDPTTYTNQPTTQLNATEVEYKPIGITDYGRFVTNPDNRSDVMSLGVASQMYQESSGGEVVATPGAYDFDGGPMLQQYPIITEYGADNAYVETTPGGPLLPNPYAGEADPTGVTATAGGGSIRVNGSARFYGLNYIFLNHGNPTTNADVTNGTSTAFSDITSKTFNDTVEIAGNLLLDGYTPGAAQNTELASGQDAALILNPNTADTQNQLDTAATTTPATGGTAFVAPSNDKFGFDTYNGAVRDGSGGTDVAGLPRSVNRLNPPQLDNVDPATNLPRYQAISEDSTPRSGITDKDASLYGYGQSIYVDNSTDVQNESSSIVGGSTLVDEWLHRTNASEPPGGKFGWTADLYRPPGVDITLGRQIDPKGNSFYGVRLTRSDVDGEGNLIGWRNPDGSAIGSVGTDGTTTQSTMTVSYDDLNASNDPTAAPASGAAGYAAYAANPNNDVVIYAEGNIRVHGVVSAAQGDSGVTSLGANDDKYPRHVTIVTNGTAYIDGSLLRGNPQSSISVLAHDYVCVNTTQFLAGPQVDQNPTGTTPPGAYAGDPALHALDFGTSDQVLLQEFNLAGSNPYLYVSGGPSSPGSTTADFDILDPRSDYATESLGAVPPFDGGPITPLGVGVGTGGIVPFASLFTSAGAGASDLFRTTFALPAAIANAPESQAYQLAIRRDPGQNESVATTDSIGSEDFLLQRAAILPMDIRIEAVLFAETRSFFVIPGPWFNTDTSDTVDAYANNSEASRPGISVTDDNQNRFPFYGQPIDMKITIDGAVSEAVTASISAESDWMAKWGWIPQYHGGLIAGGGATSEQPPAAHLSAAPDTPGIGLQIIYNPLAGYPYYQDPANTGTPGDYIRTDIYGRPLPYTPKLPVCAGLLYAGQNTSASVLQ